jgi:hypothetical protein
MEKVFSKPDYRCGIMRAGALRSVAGTPARGAPCKWRTVADTCAVCDALTGE